METKVSLQPSVNGDTLILLEGQALPQQPPQKVNIAGDIFTVGNFLKQRFANPLPSESASSGRQQVSKERSIVELNKQERTIRLLLDPEEHYGAIVTGKLEDAEELKPFAINGNKTFTREELIKLLRFHKLFFADSEKHRELLAAYQSFNAKVWAEAQAESDTRGNKNNAYKKTVETNIPNEFILTIPVFKGIAAQIFRVEIALDVTDAGARFWFESVELHELQQRLINDIFKDQVEACTGLVVINK